MKASSWFQKGNKDTRPHQPTAHQPPLSPALALPRPHTTLSTFSSLHLAVNRAVHRAPSSNSLHSSYSAGSAHSFSSPAYPDTYNPAHPFAAMVSAPLPVVSSRDDPDDEDECPVCLEPLSFSFRLPGEKPHILPECGHALHEVSLPPLPPSALPLYRLYFPPRVSLHPPIPHISTYLPVRRGFPSSLHTPPLSSIFFSTQ